MSGGSFDDGALFGTREARTEWERSKLINADVVSLSASRSWPAASYVPTLAAPTANPPQSQIHAGSASGSYDPSAGAYGCLLLFGMFCLFDVHGEFGTPQTMSAWAMQMGAEAGVLVMLLGIACLAPAPIGWPLMLGLLAADLAQALPHETPWLLKAPLVLPSWWPVWAFDCFLIALRVLLLVHGVRTIRAARVYRA